MCYYAYKTMAEVGVSMNRAFVIISILLLLGSAALCQNAEPSPPPDAAPEYASPPEYAAPTLNDKAYDLSGLLFESPRVRNRDNGIVVGQPKLFELRSLEMMIDSVKASLAQTAFPDPSQLFGMTGRAQGVSSTSSDQGIQVTGSLGLPSGDSRQAAAPTAQAAMSSTGSSVDLHSGVSLSPTDVLAEQTSLWHQLVNLQMLLDGALSDRLIPADENGGATSYGGSVKFLPRAQAVIGFQISIDPLEDYRDAVAEATIIIDNKEVSLTEPGGYGNEPSLMMLLPRNKTYNSISISRDSKSFGIGALVNVFSLGFGQDKRGETYYIGKDTDTVALERIPGLPVYGLEKASSDKQKPRYRGVSFGWQFRPVFDRTAVEPGVRQVFAMLSLPASVAQDKWEGKVHVITYWRKYDRRSGAVGKPIAGTVCEWDLDDVVVPIGSGVEEALRPRIDRAQWEDAGAGNAVVTIEGSNFSLGTDIACGNTTLGEKDLSYSSAKRIRFTVPASTVVRGDITVMGRYGIASVKQSVASDDPYKGAVLAPPRVVQQGDQTTAVELTLSQVANPERLISQRPPVVQLDGQLYGIGDKPFTSVIADGSRQTVTIRFSAPSEAIAGARELTVRDLLGTAAMSAGLGSRDGAFVARRAVVLSTGDPVTVALFGSGFRDDVRILAGGREATGVKLSAASQNAVVTFQADRDAVENAKYLLVTQGDQAPVLVPISMSAPPPPGNQPSNL